MFILKRTLLVLIASLFTSLLFLTAWDFGVMRTIGTSAPVKKTLNDSGIYDSILSGLLNQAKTNTSNSGDVSLTDPLIQKAANASFTPQVLRENTDKILDSTYKWLNGESATPDFKLDLSSVKTNFASSVATNLETQLKTLPVCPTNVKADNFDALSATCLPKGLTATTAAANVQNNLLNGKGFLDNPVITANDLKSNGSSKSVFNDGLKKAPQYYSWVKKLPYILIGLTLLTGALIILLSATRAKGLRKIGFTLVTVGVLMLVFAWGANYLVTQKAIPKISINNNAVLQQKVQLLAKDLTHEIDITYWMFGIAYAVIGASAIGYPMIASRFGRNKSGKEESKKETGPTGESKPEASKLPEALVEDKVPTKTEEPKKRTINIQ